MFFRAGCYYITSQKISRYFFTNVLHIARMDLQPPLIDQLYTSFEELLKVMQQIKRERRRAERENTNGAEKKGEYRAESETGWRGGEGIKGRWGTGTRRHHISYLAFPISHLALHISHRIGILPRLSFHIAPLVFSFSHPPTPCIGRIDWGSSRWFPIFSN